MAIQSALTGAALTGAASTVNSVERNEFATRQQHRELINISRSCEGGCMLDPSTVVGLEWTEHIVDGFQLTELNDPLRRVERSRSSANRTKEELYDARHSSPFSLTGT